MEYAHVKDYRDRSSFRMTNSQLSIIFPFNAAHRLSEMKSNWSIFSFLIHLQHTHCQVPSRAIQHDSPSFTHVISHFQELSRLYNHHSPVKWLYNAAKCSHLLLGGNKRETTTANLLSTTTLAVMVAAANRHDAVTNHSKVEWWNHNHIVIDRRQTKRGKESTSAFSLNRPWFVWLMEKMKQFIGDLNVSISCGSKKNDQPIDLRNRQWEFIVDVDAPN